MVAPSYDDEGMYCPVCGEHVDVPPTHTTQGSKTRTTHTARYRARGRHDEVNGLRHLTVRYMLAFADRSSPMPALIMKCPWCGGVTKSRTWAQPKREINRSLSEREMFVECPSNHTYSMVCDADGDYYWR